MIGTMLKPFFKKFIGPFISMVFVSMLSIGLLTAFASTLRNLGETFRTYLSEYEDVNVVADIGFTSLTKLADLSQVDGVEAVEYRLTMTANMKTADDKHTYTMKLFTFKDDGTSRFNRFVLKTAAEKSADKVNVSIVRKFADNNGFKPGDSVKIGFYDTFLDCYVYEIIETPEAILPRVNALVWSDNTDFGYVYVAESELDKLIAEAAVAIENKIEANDAFRAFYEKAVEAAGGTIPDLVDTYVLGMDYTRVFANQILIKGEDGLPEEVVVYNVNKYLKTPEKEIKVDSVTENHKQAYYAYVENSIKTMRVAAVFLPVFFFSVTMIIISLFINQIIKAMTPQIGIMMSIGAGKLDIISIFQVFTLIMSLCAGALGTGVAIGLNRMLASALINVYSIPTIPYGVNPLIAVLSVLALMVFAQGATAFSCRSIFRITPKDATISNEAKRKRMSPKLEAAIDRAPMIIRLGVNSIAQNPKRFLVSAFAILASFVIILMSLFFYDAKMNLLHQTVDERWSFDAQVYMASVATEEDIAAVRSQPSVKQFLDCYCTYAKVENLYDSKKHASIACVGFDEDPNNDLIVIPDEKGKGDMSLPSSGVVLPQPVAKAIGVKKGDWVKMNGVPYRVSAISFQYGHTIAFMTKAELVRMDMQYISTYILNLNDDAAFLTYMQEHNPATVTVFSKNLRKDMRGMFGAIDIFIYLLIGFSLAMGFIILCIMGQNALMEQKRQISVFRLIGFTVLDVSNLWTLQGVAQLVLSSIFAIPAGVGASAALYAMVNSSSQIFPLTVKATTVLAAFAFVFVIIVASHLLSMLSIKRWNLADNTRSRE